MKKKLWTQALDIRITEHRNAILISHKKCNKLPEISGIEFLNRDGLV